MDRRPFVLWTSLGLLFLFACDGGESPTQKAATDRAQRTQTGVARRAEFHRLVRTAGEADREGRSTEAIESYAAALAMQPDSESAAVGLANLMMAAGRVDRASALLEGVVESDPRNTRALISLSRLYSVRRPGGRIDYELAMEFCEQAMVVNGGDTAVWLQKGRLQRLMGAHDAATTTLEAALDSNPGWGEAVIELASVHASQSRFGRAAEALVGYLKGQLTRARSIPKGATEEGDTEESDKLPKSVRIAVAALATLAQKAPAISSLDGFQEVKAMLPPAPSDSVTATASVATPIDSVKGATYLRFGPADSRAQMTIVDGPPLGGIFERAFVTAAAADPGKRLVVGSVHDGAPNDLLFFELDGRLPDANELPRFRIVMDHVVTSLSLDGDLLAVAIDGEGFRLLAHGKGAASAHDEGAWNDMTAERGFPIDLRALSVLFADINADGRNELLVGCADGAIRVFIQSDIGQFEAASPSSTVGRTTRGPERMEIGKTSNGKQVVFIDIASDDIFSPRRTLLLESGADGKQRITALERGSDLSSRSRVSEVRIL